jgi:hypothetical protein
VHHAVLPLIHDAASAVGWLAAAVVLAGYALMVSGRIAADGAVYLTVNAVGSLGLAVSTVASHAWQSALVNVLWLVFGVHPLRRALRRRRASHQRAQAHRGGVVGGVERLDQQLVDGDIGGGLDGCRDGEERQLAARVP